VDGIPHEGSEWQFPRREWYQINDCSNQDFGHKDSTDPSEVMRTSLVPNLLHLLIKVHLI